MGFVVQYTKETIGEMTSETNIHFESYEDFKDYQVGKLDFVGPTQEGVELSTPETIEHDGVVWYVHDGSARPIKSHINGERVISVVKGEELDDYDPYPCAKNIWDENDWRETKFYRYV